MTDNFYLLAPEKLSASYKLSESFLYKVSDFLGIIAQPSPSKTHIQQAIDALLINLRTEDIRPSGTPDEQVCDDYFRIKRLHSEDDAQCQILLASILISKKAFQEATASLDLLLSDGNEYWLTTHWSFISLIQGLIICFLRFESHLLANNLKAAAIELETASTLMLSSGAAMEMAGRIGGEVFRSQVRPKMGQELSGIMMLDHNFLITIWKRLHPYFGSLPDQLKHQHEEFISSYKVLATSHKAVCDRFGGSEHGSLLLPKLKATETLTRFEINRLRMLQAKSDIKMPEDLLPLDDKQYVELGFKTLVDLLMRGFGLQDSGLSSTSTAELSIADPVRSSL
ncbi:hypothetical protein ACE1CD_08400 [Aerosakkonema sp. BLCC-F183]|uniref:hypothetical protein n=1 Tax=Aerosakkonema sp. BLCC-F183 TaxID=3342834 RepID=UPI0035B6FDE5